MSDSRAKIELTSAAVNPELIAMLGTISTQLRAALRDTEGPATTLVTVAHKVNHAAEVIAKCVFDFAGSPTRVFQDLVVLHDDMHAHAGKAATAVQFHDRLVQRLTHVCTSLAYIAEFLSRVPERQTVADWQKLQERIRGTFSMENERIVFDMHKCGSATKDAQTAPAENNAHGTGQVEFF